MTAGAVLLAICLLAPSQTEQDVGASASAPDLFVESWLGTAGPYGEGWQLRLTPNGDIFLHVIYSLNPSGTLMAEFHVPEEYMARVRRVIESERFFELPNDLSPKASPLHMPDFSLEVIDGDELWRDVRASSRPCRGAHLHQRWRAAAKQYHRSQSRWPESRPSPQPSPCRSTSP